MILTIEQALVAALAADPATAHFPAVCAASGEVTPERGFIIVDASGLQLGVAGTGFGPIAVRYSAPALPGGSENEYETAVAALGDFLRSPARIAGAWQFIGVQWIGGKLETSTTLVEENRWVCEFSLLSYVKVV
jgi:hypothetical protein